ncbi:hypothetical protein FE391_34390 [Nonomuraea sp. KC401]|uniref:hypothetical protein n=1 Tax=unclassified Nonomuraea TaxID=2593643 RepID=UPI0010FD4A7E|nr:MULTISPECIES: hypothetical protein [unclassified Nonomuraea]NBE98729.1 hypothetical protein [Nonomuraea sp. K271]TLF59696.1 hypothetical protein FE391_34390 [Nonomuraea sp. KC401]
MAPRGTFAIGNLGGSAGSDRLTGRFGRRVLVTGLALNMVGLIALWLILATVAATSLTIWKMLAPLLIAVVGSVLFGSLDLTASPPESTAHTFGQSAALAMAASAAFSILAFALVFALPKRVGNPW